MTLSSDLRGDQCAPLTYGSLFSGIGGFDLGFDRAGMRCSWQVENDKNCRHVLTRHWPGVMRIEDVHSVTEQTAPTVSLICGGFPCQDVSVAGRRAGLDGERSGLWYEFHRILAEMRPRWCVIENVPGPLSSNGGRDFAAVLRGLVECGYGVCWRVLDSQYFGVAQRRRRVFIAGHLGDGRAAQVLFERESGGGDTPARREAGQDVAYSLRSGSTADDSGDARGVVIPPLTGTGVGAGRTGNERNEADFLIAAPLGAHSPRYDLDNETYVWNARQITSPKHQARPPAMADTVGEMMVGVRRLTPTECERLQGFPDGWTGGQSDSVRYRQLGNAVTVTVAEWIGRRIMQIEERIAHDSIIRSA